MKTVKTTTQAPRRAPTGSVRNRQARLDSPRWDLILVPLDFSGQSRQALEVALPLAERHGGKIVLVHVVQAPGVLSAIPGGGQYLVPMDNAKAVKTAKVHIETLAAELVPARLLARTLVRQGNPADQITTAARALKADLIIIATHGYSGLKHVLIGSTAERVVRHAPCPVFVVRRRGE